MILLKGTISQFSGLCLVLLLLNACQTEPKETKTQSGFTYIHHVKNNGPTPKEGEEAEFHVDLRNHEKVINTSRSQGRPARAIIPTMEQIAKTPSPIVDALLLMSVGDSLTVMQSTDSLPNKPPQFADSPLIYFDVVLSGIKSKEEIEKERAEQAAQVEIAKARESEVAATTTGLLTSYKANKLGDKLQSTGTGLKYTVIEEGTGPQAEVGKLVNVHYYGMTTDGNEFDNSFKRGSAYPVPVGRGQVIKGWDEGIPLFKEGTKAVLFIPHELGYGEAGSPPNIPPRAELVFYVEIEKVN